MWWCMIEAVSSSQAWTAGEEWRGTPRLAAVVRVFDCAFFRKIILRHDSGLGESYMDNDFEVGGHTDSSSRFFHVNAVTYLCSFNPQRRLQTNCA